MTMTPTTTTLPVASTRETWRAVRRLARPRRRLLAGTLAVLIVATTAALAVPLLLGSIVDVVLDGAGVRSLDLLVGGLVAALVVQGVFVGLGALGVGRVGEQVLASLREEVVDRALSVPLDVVERAGTGDLVARACGDVDAVSEATRTALPDIVASSLAIGLTVVGLATLDWRLALAGLAAVPMQAVTTRWYLRRSAPVYAAERAAEGQRSEQLHVSVSGARTVRALRLHRAHAERIEATSARSLALAVQTGKVRAFFFSGLNVAEIIGLSAVLVAGFALVRSGDITVGQATAAALYFIRLFDPIGSLLFQLDTAQEAGAALARLIGVTSLPSAPAVVDDDLPAEASVTLSGVRFAYPGQREVLHGVDLHLAPGERVALVGTSGAGKTTIAKLVAGVHAPTAGDLQVGGDEAVDGGPGRRVALVAQEVHVFAGSVAADLRLARPDATDDELHTALDLVGAKGWVEALPEGIHTPVGRGGHSLGPAEAQQLALARLVLVDPGVAILDEATAEAGSAGARLLEASAAAAIEGRTALVVAHRLTQAAAADRIVVLEDGAVVEEGAHDALLAADGRYARLWAAWSLGR